MTYWGKPSHKDLRVFQNTIRVSTHQTFFFGRAVFSKKIIDFFRKNSPPKIKIP